MRARRLRVVAWGLGITVLLVSAMTLLLAEDVGGTGVCSSCCAPEAV